MSFTYPVEETQATRIAELEAQNARLRAEVEEWKRRAGLVEEMAQTRQHDEYLPSTLKRVSLIEEHFRGKKPDGE